jgi:hypothetical protein
MGANIAADIARGELSEATIGYSVLDNALLLQVGGCAWWRWQPVRGARGTALFGCRCPRFTIGAAHTAGQQHALGANNRLQ